MVARVHVYHREEGDGGLSRVLFVTMDNVHHPLPTWCCLMEAQGQLPENVDGQCTAMHFRKCLKCDMFAGIVGEAIINDVHSGKFCHMSD